LNKSEKERLLQLFDYMENYSKELREALDLFLEKDTSFTEAFGTFLDDFEKFKKVIDNGCPV
jgi:hypothetical protein